MAGRRDAGKAQAADCSRADRSVALIMLPCLFLCQHGNSHQKCRNPTKQNHKEARLAPASRVRAGKSGPPGLEGEGQTDGEQQTPADAAPGSDTKGRGGVSLVASLDLSACVY